MRDKPNIIFLVFDTMRKDAIGAYSGASNTPFIDGFAREAVVYKNCISPSPWTIPSHASFFTGTYPTDHGIHETHEGKWPSVLRAMKALESETFAEYAESLGYMTVGFSANPFVGLGSGFDRGFQIFNYIDARAIDDRERADIDLASRYGHDPRHVAWNLLSQVEIRKFVKLYLTYRGIKRKERRLQYPLLKGGQALVESVQHSSLAEPFLLFANFMEMHEPYVKYEMDYSHSIEGCPGISIEDLLGVRVIPRQVMKQIRDQYYLAANKLDSIFGLLIRYLKGQNLYNDSLIIVFSDHGQALKERDYYGHGIFLYDEIVEVPLIVKYPKNRRFDTARGYQSLVDIPSHIKDVIEGDVRTDTLTTQSVFSESFGFHHRAVAEGKTDRPYDAQRRAIYKDGYKLVANLSDEIVEEFSHNGKTIEQENRKTEQVNSLLRDLHAYSKNTTGPPASTPFQQEEELVILERLRRLGYI